MVTLPFWKKRENVTYLSLLGEVDLKNPSTQKIA